MGTGSPSSSWRQEALGKSWTPTKAVSAPSSADLAPSPSRRVPPFSGLSPQSADPADVEREGAVVVDAVQRGVEREGDVIERRIQAGRAIVAVRSILDFPEAGSAARLLSAGGRLPAAGRVPAARLLDQQVQAEIEEPLQLARRRQHRGRLVSHAGTRSCFSSDRQPRLPAALTGGLCLCLVTFAGRRASWE